MSLILKVLFWLIALAIVGFGLYFVLIKVVGIVILKNTSPPPTIVISKETSVSRTNLPIENPRNTDKVTTIDLSLLAQSIINARDDSRILDQFPDKTALANSCAEEIRRSQIIQPYPGYEYSYYKSEVFKLSDSNYNDRKTPEADFKITVSTQYSEKQYSKYEFMKDFALSDDFRFLIDFKLPDKCLIIEPFEKIFYLPSRRLIPTQVQLQATKMAQSDPLVRKRFQERTYETSTNFWHSAEDISMMSTDYFGDQIKDKLIVSGGKAFVSIDFQSRIDTCESYYFPAFVDTITGNIIVGELKRGNRNCMYPG